MPCRRIVLVLAVVPWPCFGGMPVFPEPALPELYGRVTLDASSSRAGIPPVPFDHWRHRAMFSCRPCHVDVGFAMQAGASQISRATNAAGLHCGACHNGKTRHASEPIFPACSASGGFDARACGRCHEAGARARTRSEYDAFTAKLPLYAGRYVDWEVAEARGLVKPLDYVEGVSMRRDAMRIDADVPIEARGTWLGDVTFSHRKHAVWNGCEACHPEIFPTTKRGVAKFDMADVRAGKHCGVCHGTVAFPIAQCQKCHETRGRALRPARQ